MYNTDGQEVLGLEYDEIGCTEKYKSIADPVVVIPKYELIVAKRIMHMDQLMEQEKQKYNLH